MLSNNCCESSISSKRARLNLESSDDVSAVPLGRHLSKSASELSSPRELPETRPYSAAPASQHHIHSTVVQKTHNFFSTLKNRWTRSKSRERGRRKSPSQHDSTDYAADLSSDHSTPSTQSPRRRQQTVTGIPPEPQLTPPHTYHVPVSAAAVYIHFPPTPCGSSFERPRARFTTGTIQFPRTVSVKVCTEPSSHGKYHLNSFSSPSKLLLSSLFYPDSTLYKKNVPDTNCIAGGVGSVAPPRRATVHM